jgi:hypothetical protein
VELTHDPKKLTTPVFKHRFLDVIKEIGCSNYIQLGIATPIDHLRADILSFCKHYGLKPEIDQRADFTFMTFRNMEGVQLLPAHIEQIRQSILKELGRGGEISKPPMQTVVSSSLNFSPKPLEID